MNMQMLDAVTGAQYQTPATFRQQSLPMLQRFVETLRRRAFIALIPFAKRSLARERKHIRSKIANDNAINLMRFMLEQGHKTPMTVKGRKHVKF